MKDYSNYVAAAYVLAFFVLAGMTFFTLKDWKKHK